jgi:hypothetical protein
MVMIKRALFIEGHGSKGGTCVSVFLDFEHALKNVPGRAACMTDNG